MTNRISEIQIIPIKPQNGLIGFASLVLDGNLYLGSIGIMTRLNGGYRLTYPTKTVGSRELNIYYPINKQFADAIEKEVIKRLEEVMKNENDRHSQINNT
jgi:stage V sporulation protein G